MAVLKRQFRISQSGLESCPWLMEDPCRHSRQAPSPYSALHARWLAPRGPSVRRLPGPGREAEGATALVGCKVLGRYTSLSPPPSPPGSPWIPGSL